MSKKKDKKKPSDLGHPFITKQLDRERSRKKQQAAHEEAKRLRRERNKKQKKALKPGEPEYIKARANGVNKQKAAREAGLLSIPSRPIVEYYVREIVRKKMAEYEITAADVLLEIRRGAMVNLRDMYDDNGKFLPIHLMDEDTQRAIVSLEQEVVRGEGGEMITTIVCNKVKTAKDKYLEMLAKYYKILSGEGGSTKKDRLSEVVEALQASPVAPPEVAN